MRRSLLAILALSAIALFAPLSSAQAQSLVLPPDSAVNEGDTGLSELLGVDAVTVQWLFDDVTSAALAPGDTITGIFFAQDGPLGITPYFGGTYSDWSLTVSSTSLTAGSLSTNFADNIGPDAILVRSGELTIDDTSFPADASPDGPNAFGPEITFSSTYVYTGGNLLFTLTHTGRTGDALTIDGQSNSAYQYLSAEGSNASASTQSVFAAPVVGLSVTFASVAAPEPTSGLLIGATLSLVSFVARRRRR